MSLEHALLDRLEKRSLQIAQQKNEIYGLRQLVDEKNAINEQLAEQITTARLEREQMQHQISELRTERDRIREISKSLVPKSALKQAVQEAAELHAEVAKLRAEVPLESTREGLKNATAKLQEVTAQLDNAKGEAEEWLKQCHAARRQRDEVKAEARAETQRLSDLCAELQSKYESLLAKTADLGSYAMTLGRKEGEPLEMFMERQALRLAAFETKIELRPIENRIGHFAVICTKCDELAKSRTELAEAMERVTQLRSESESLRAELQGYMAGESEAMEAAKVNGIQPFEKLAGFIYRHAACLRQAQAANAPLNKLYYTMRKHRDDCNIQANAEPIYRAINEASDAIKKLTA